TGVCITTRRRLRSRERHPLSPLLRGELAVNGSVPRKPECPVSRGACPSPFALSSNEKVLGERGKRSAELETNSTSPRWPCATTAPSSLLLGGDHHDHEATFHARILLDDRLLGDFRGNLVDHGATEFLMSHFAAAKADRDLDLVALREKPPQVAHLDLVVADIGGRPELEFLDLDLLGLLPRRVRLLLLIELELAEIHDPANRRFGVRLDLDQIHARVLGQRECFIAAQDARLLPFGIDHPHLRGADFVVAAISLVFGGDTITLPAKRIRRMLKKFI